MHLSFVSLFDLPFCSFFLYMFVSFAATRYICMHRKFSCTRNYTSDSAHLSCLDHVHRESVHVRARTLMCACLYYFLFKFRWVITSIFPRKCHRPYTVPKGTLALRAFESGFQQFRKHELPFIGTIGTNSARSLCGWKFDFI